MNLEVLVSGAFSAALKQIKPVYENESGIMISSTLAPSMGGSPDSLPNRLARGEAADVVIMVGPDLRELEAKGELLQGSVVDLAKASVAVAVRSGSPKPDIGSESALRQVLLDAGSIGVSESASGVYVRGELLRRLGIEDEVGGKVHVVSERPVGEAVARGDADIGFQQLAELMPIQGISVVGLLPESVQHVTVIAAAVGAATGHKDAALALVAFLASPKRYPLFEKNGLQPPTDRKPASQGSRSVDA